MFNHGTTGPIYKFVTSDAVAMGTRISPGSMSAVNAEVATRHEAAGVAEEEEGGAAILLGLAESLEHVLRGPLRLSLWVLFKQVEEHLGRAISRRECVDTNAVHTPFSGQASSHLHDTSLGGVV